MNFKTDNRKPFPEKVFLENTSWDEAGLIFEGVIDWRPTSYNRAQLMKYSLTFSQDLHRIESELVQGIDKKGLIIFEASVSGSDDQFKLKIPGI